MDAVITLTTDFGTQDAYVAAMKGVILKINPKATLVDICHSIEPQNIRQAAFVLSTAYNYFPPDTIHIIIIDPGVGSQRRAIALKTAQAFFLAPDNGALSYVIDQASPRENLPTSGKSSPAIKSRKLPPGLLAVEITNPRFWHHPVSSTFHGRDIFAPVAAHLSLGMPLQQFGEVINSLVILFISHPQVKAAGELVGNVLHIDRFGNLITDIRKEDLESGNLVFEISGQQIHGLSICYADTDQLLALVGSSGYIEISVKNGNAATLLGARVGDEIKVNRN
jgi:hypothetical protein